jgi:hypothetical protein
MGTICLVRITKRPSLVLSTRALRRNPGLFARRHGIPWQTEEADPEKRARGE